MDKDAQEQYNIYIRNSPWVRTNTFEHTEGK